MSGRTEIEDWKSRLERSKSVINQLESDKIVMQQQLQQQVADLSSKLEEQGATFRSQVYSKLNILFDYFYILLLSVDVQRP